jgi:hypothetical protein
LSKAGIPLVVAYELLWLGPPLSEIILGIIEDLSCLSSTNIRPTLVSWNDRRIIQEFQQSLAMSS